MKKYIVPLLSLTLAACSMNNSNNDQIVKNEDLEFTVDTYVDYPAPQEFVANEEAITMDEAPVLDHNSFDLGQNKSDIAQNKPEIIESPEKSISDRLSTEFGDPFISGDRAESLTQKYVVQKGDTLMMIAFKIYGDYAMWKQISQDNGNVRHLRAGMELNYRVPTTDVSWKPEGSPYLIKRGDSLGTISRDLYNTSKMWKYLYEFNKPLIKDPNLIFAGFTIYYNPERSLASEKE